MNNQLTVYNGLQQCFGISVSPCNSNNLENSIIIDDNLYTTIENSLKTEFGNTDTALKMSIEPTKYRKYYDGTYSSMINDSVSKIKHEGFEGVNLIEVAKNIYDGVNKNIAQSILKKYNQSLLSIFSAVNNARQEIGDIIIAEHLSEIESYKLFYEDLQEDINEIIVNPARRLAYLNTIISNKTEIYKNFSFLLGRLNYLVNTTNNCYQYTPTESELKNILLKISFLIKLNINNCIYEYVLTGDYTKSPINKILRRGKEMERKLLNSLNSLKQTYNNIFGSFNLFISNSYSNGFFVKDSLNNFNENTLLLDYSELNNLYIDIINRLKNVKLVTRMNALPNVTFCIQEPENWDDVKKVRQKHAKEVEKYLKHDDNDNLPDLVYD